MCGQCEPVSAAGPPEPPQAPRDLFHRRRSCSPRGPCRGSLPRGWASISWETVNRGRDLGGERGAPSGPRPRCSVSPALASAAGPHPRPGTACPSSVSTELASPLEAALTHAHVCTRTYTHTHVPAPSPSPAAGPYLRPMPDDGGPGVAQLVPAGPLVVVDEEEVVLGAERGRGLLVPGSAGTREAACDSGGRAHATPGHHPRLRPPPKPAAPGSVAFWVWEEGENRVTPGASQVEGGSCCPQAAWPRLGAVLRGPSAFGRASSSPPSRIIPGGKGSFSLATLPPGADGPPTFSSLRTS